MRGLQTRLAQWLKTAHIQAWIRKQLSVKMRRDYDLDVSACSFAVNLLWTLWVVDRPWRHAPHGWDKVAFREVRGTQANPVRDIPVGFQCTQVYLILIWCVSGCFCHEHEIFQQEITLCVVF